MNSQTLNQLDARNQQEIDNERQKATDEAQRCVDQEAVSALKETRNAINAINQKNTQEALQALERATGKLEILVARYPELGFVPVSAQVNIIDLAPDNSNEIERIRNRIKSTVNGDDFRTARQLLNSLVSEIRTTIFNLPLETYPDAMKEAARLLNEGKTDEAKTVLQLALSTLVVTEVARPLPLLRADIDIMSAVAIADSDRERTLRLLEDARNHLRLTQQLGYAKGDPEYAELEQAIQDIERQVRANERTADPLSRLLEKFSSFFKRISGTAPAQPA
ncbi:MULTISPECIES: YfdX family protein [unclassified Nostoc]|jgi:biopolymer transport protein ExbB/TolQ|uniref:YfdX family protein n=1 Tax=unclassified Nostoc TaxID=2593658 RepID=UPI0015C32E15|nr:MULTISPECIES: YfdX family protein [unclassified Nostoc]MBN3883426.1 YfdX family protein [Nostoc sp. JL34]QLE52852.1 YfdX family protein [Nostoc sp. C057]